MRHSIAMALAALALVGGCGGGSTSGEDVVRAWSRALNTGDNEAAAGLFAPGAQIIQAGQAIRLGTHEEAVAWNAALPCSGTIVELETEGNTVTATFVLADRAASPCDAPGAQATAAFRIEDGRIVLWHQLDSLPVQEGPAI